MQPELRVVVMEDQSTEQEDLPDLLIKLASGYREAKED